jgi:hypothetical protein
VRIRGAAISPNPVYLGQPQYLGAEAPDPRQPEIPPGFHPEESTTDEDNAVLFCCERCLTYQV